MHNRRALSAWLSASVCALAACGPAPVARPQETLEPWPFTVDEVTLSCTPGTRAVFVTTPDSRRFAVNGTARAEAPLMRPIQGAIDTGPLIRMGLALCETGRGQAHLVAPAGHSSTAASPPRFSIEPVQFGEGVNVTVEAQDVIDGHRPALTFSCRPGQAPTLLIDVAQAPRSPPPLRGVYATFSVGGEETREEVSWGEQSLWMLRSGDARQADRELTRAVLAAGKLTMTPAQTYMPQHAVTWDLTGFQTSELARARRLCSG